MYYPDPIRKGRGKKEETQRKRSYTGNPQGLKKVI